jgi:translation initiation factor IF-2
MAAGETSNLNIIIKTDVQGSLEALRASLVGLSHELHHK